MHIKTKDFNMYKVNIKWFNMGYVSHKAKENKYYEELQKDTI